MLIAQLLGDVIVPALIVFGLLWRFVQAIEWLLNGHRS